MKIAAIGNKPKRYLSKECKYMITFTLFNPVIAIFIKDIRLKKTLAIYNIQGTVQGILNLKECTTMHP